MKWPPLTTRGAGLRRVIVFSPWSFSHEGREGHVDPLSLAASEAAERGDAAAESDSLAPEEEELELPRGPGKVREEPEPDRKSVV